MKTLATLLLLCGAAVSPALSAEPATTSCLTCHGDPETFEDGIVAAFADDVHASVGLSCHDCHGGNANPAVADDSLAAMDERYAANPYRSKPSAQEIPALCGRCHSNLAIMRRFQPEARVDQETEYWTSRHGERLKAGETRVATCVSCHGVHGIRRPSDPASHVHPKKVAETCGSCHSDATRMAGFQLADGRPVPVDQQERWQRSVHAAAMFDREDLTAPTCNDCHGNHGAKPPGVDSIAYVCGRCHGREAKLFRESPKFKAFEEHQQRVTDAGSEGCAACHSAPEPAATLAGDPSFHECATCHGNHSVVRPTIALLAPLPQTPCALCHEGDDSVEKESPEPERILRNYTTMRDSLLRSAEEQKLTGDLLFDWLVDRARQLPTHTLESAKGEPVLRPEFARLFSKFRIGKTHFSYRDPRTGQEVVEAVRRCTACHAEKPESIEEPVGYDASRHFLDKMRHLTVLTARAERIVLSAKRGGVETRDALLDLDKAVDSQIELEVLVHGFSRKADSAFDKKHAEGIQFANRAIEAGHRSLGELGYRRKGLFVSLGFIALLLIALAMKIRSLG
jgi:hypothetical protein